ncbi:hypothetical protein QTP70_033536 [Hemibagrus guttatus]|uniref:Uncharacterized protein n=1 Tax=Hemibagrus guttatus TaxID=175788 RepID=A0AAE0RFL5_9TELE|nr:hypothetical protein QTP70_033536 [Hemibagrus guttatus]
MYTIRKLYISCLVIFCMNWTLSEVPPQCCVESFTNKSVMYRVSTGERCRNMWNREKTPIKDEHGNVNNSIVLDYGPNWILLTGNFSGINFRCMDPDQCEPGGVPEPTPPSNVSVILIIIIAVIVVAIVIICLRRSR